jgi:pimeloyl-ACP methyl ester carboxylesterase
MTTTWIDGHEGVAIALSDRGAAALDEAPPAPTALLVHGFAHDRTVWAGIADRLAPRRRVVRMDLRGHGESGWSTTGRYAVEDHAGDVVAVLDAIGPGPVVVIAHSLGGHAATLATAARPERVAALALVDTGPSLSLSGMRQVGAGTSGLLRSYASPAQYRVALDHTYPLADAATLDRLARSGLVRRRDGRYEPRLDPALLFGELDAAVLAATESRLWDALGAVRCPTLVVRGATSAMLSADVARRMADEVLADGRLVTIDGAGHSVMLDAEPLLAEHLLGFFESAAASNGTATSNSAAAIDGAAASYGSAASADGVHRSSAPPAAPRAPTPAAQG